MKTIFLFIMLTTIISAQTRYTDIKQLIHSGEFKEASSVIDEKLKSSKFSSTTVKILFLCNRIKNFFRLKT